MATTTDDTLVAFVEEQNPASAVAKQEPPKKAESAVATANEAASLAPLVDENLTPMEEEASKKVEMLAAAEEGKEAFKKVMVNEEDKEIKGVGLEGKGESFAGLEVVNGEVEGDTGGDNGWEVEKVEEDSKGGSLGATEAMNDNVSESKLENGELEEKDAFLASPDVLESEERGELQEEQQEEEQVGVGVEAKVVDKIEDDTEFVVAKVKPELEGEKVKEVGSRGADGGKLGEKEATDDTMVMGGEEGPEGSTEKDVDVPTSEVSTVIVNDRRIVEFALESADNVLENIPRIEQNAEGQTTANEVVEDVGVDKHTMVENIADVVEEGIDIKKHIEDMKNDVSGELEAQKTEVVISMVEPTPIPSVESKSEDCELREEDASIASHEALEGEERVQMWEEEQEEEVGAIVQAKVVDDAGTAMAEDEKPKLECEKLEKVGFGDENGGKLGKKKEVEVSIASIEAADLEDKLASFTEANRELSYQKESTNDIISMGGEEAMEELIRKDVDVPTSEVSIVVVSDGSAEEVIPSSADSVLENSPWIQQNAEVVDDIGVEKSLEYENFIGVIEDIDIKMHKEVENVGVVVEVVDIEKHKKAVKDDVSREPVVQDTCAIVSMVEPVPIPGMESNLENSELGEADDSLASSNTPKGDKRGELWEDEEVGVVVHAKVANKVADDVESAVVEENPEPEDEKVEEVGSKSRDGGQLGKQKMVEVSVVNVEAVELEDKLAPFAEANTELGYQKQASDDTVAVGGEEALKEPTEKVVDVPMSEARSVVVNDGCIEEAALESINSVLEDSLGIEQYAEGQATASEVVEGVGVKKPSEVENVVVVVEDADVKKYAEVEHAVAVVEAIDVEKLMKIENFTATRTDHTLPQELAPESSKKSNDSKESECSSKVIDCEEEVDDDGIIKIVTTAEDGVGNEAYEHDDGANFDTSPARMAILESTESTKQIMKKFAEDYSSGSVSGLRDLANSMDRQIMLDGSKENDDNGDGAKKGFDSATLAALVERATSETSYGNIKVSSQDGSKILTMDEPAGPGSSTLSLMPTAPCQHAQSNLFSSAELAVTADPTEEMTEEEKNLHDKVELIQVKFLRLVYRLGATFEETVTSQVLYRLSLVEGIMHMHGKQTNQDFSLDNARKKAFILEAEGKEDLNFTCNILVLGKTGVGKSATINSIFGEDKSKTDAFSSATTSVQEYIGDVHGIKIRIIDTPGFRASVMDQGSNRKILTAIKKYTKKCPPDIIVYVDRLDSLSHDFNDLPLLKTITSVLGSSVWFNAIVALTHAASAPPEGLNGAPVTYEVLMAQRSHIIHQSIRQAAGDMRLMNPIALVENHPSCRRNHEGHKVLPNGQSWRHQMLLLCYSSKILSEANSLLKSQDPNPREIFGFHFQPLPFMLSSLLQSRAHPKLSAEQGGNEGDFHIELDDYSNVQQDGDEEKHDQLLPFKPLTKAHLARVTRKQKKQWKDEICKFKEMKKRGETDLDDYGYANIADNVSVPLPNIVLPPSFDCDNPTYRYRFLEPTSTILSRPVLDAHGWDHDYGYDGVSMEETLAILDRFPANVAVQVTKDKKEFTIHMDSSIAAKHGENASSIAGFDIKTVGRQPVYILHGETKIIKNIKKNETTGGFSVTFLGDTVATGLKVEDQLSLGKRLSLVASTGAMQVQGDTAYGANLEACLNDKHYPIGQSRSTLGLSLMKWRRDLALGANLQSQFSIARGSKMALRLGLNNKLSGQITVRTSTSDQVQIALLGLVPVAASIYKSFRPSEPSSI
ncbi:hypothetical protein GQ55_3G114800 [Panicum hallii var. hallii]|uniref:AIG1-type G domain-containing protein n=1 Tax=Panicum hallii var. hallii TaxID=1504633 RepID=A0A2T7E8C6_9POAL|nr:hypothetical protein GQ55_3G114800 [Panicum hallii var. hallii]